MNRKLSVSLLVVAVLLFASTGALAQSLGPAAPQALLGTGFTYQGQLKTTSGPAPTSCDFRFSLWNAAGSGSPPAGGTQVGNLSPVSGVNISNGLFTAVVNSGNEFGNNAFTGEARWLQIAVACPSGNPNYITLSPRQALTATPYALSLAPNATIAGLNNTGNLSFGVTTRQMLNLWGTQYGIGVQSYTLYYRTDYGGGFAWYEGGAHDDSAGSPGYLGLTQMRLSQGTLTVANGVQSTSAGESAGVFQNYSTSNNKAVLRGETNGSGSAVKGTNTSGSVWPCGDFGCPPNNGGSAGEFWIDNTTNARPALVASTNGLGDGVVGSSSKGVGVAGYSSGNGVDAASGHSVGVYGQCNNCLGVYGSSDSQAGVYGLSVHNYGVWGETVYGAAGVLGKSISGMGVQGQSADSNGVQGQSSSSAASGVYGENFAGGNGVAGRANGVGAAVLGDNTSASGYAGHFYGRVRVEGSLEFTGNLVGGNKLGYVSDFAVNAGGESLMAGDVVVVIGYTSPLAGRIPVARVVKASQAYQTGVIGVVDQHVTRSDPLIFEDEPVAPGEYLNIVTLGMFRTVKVDASQAAIAPGDLLVASPHAGYAMKATDRTQAIGAIIGKALGSLATGQGIVPIIVTLQ